MPARLWALFFPFLLTMSSAYSTARAASPATELHAARQEGDIEYARVSGVSLRMDASIPAGAKRSPAVIIVHGGAWVAGDRKFNVQPLFQPLTDAGFAWFSISYRLATDITQFGAAVSDVREAIRFVKSHAAEYHIDPDEMALIGESAGGQLAAMAVLRGGPDTSVKAVVALYTPSDLVSLAKDSTYIPASVRNSVRGTPFEALVLAGLAQLSPINNVGPGMPPFLFIHGTADSMVPFTQSQEMCNRMQQAGASCELYPVVGGGHGMRWWESSPRLATGYKRKIIDWLRQELGSPTAPRS
ncbi:MAG: alpha/beta hydrolase fold domain-containing protein [Bryobacteraceae bacterium]